MSASPGIEKVAALPISGSGGGNSEAADKLNNVSVTLAAASLQAAEDSKFDPKVVSGTPTIIRPTKQGFCSPFMDVPSACMLVGVLLIVYGMIAK
jgi:hypothetical protein